MPALADHTEPSSPHASLSVADGPPAPVGGAHLSLLPWPDPVIDRLGHDPRSAYVERFWLGAIGPSCTWLLRHLAQRFDDAPDGFVLDVADCARAIGLGAGLGRNAPFGRTVGRVCQFGLARRFGADGLVVRRRLPPLARHQVLRLPETLQQEHQSWLDAPPSSPPTTSSRSMPAAPATAPPPPVRPTTVAMSAADQRRRAEEAGRQALALLDAGHEPAAAHRVLVVDLLVPPALAHAAIGWALSRRRATTTDLAH